MLARDLGGGSSALARLTNAVQRLRQRREAKDGGENGNKHQEEGSNSFLKSIEIVPNCRCASGSSGAFQAQAAEKAAPATSAEVGLKARDAD